MLNGQVVLRDNTSSGGTYLNDKKISTSRSKSAPYALRNGDVVQLAKDHIGRSGEKHRCVIIKVEIYS
ncbi:uncharacterized protein B0P05DRAFT_520892 [Gilbertella persicaria]|uniref:uncharacterized protein n=1 Tax=Gilbertella persicaria TaxID=101096 RepID=UPI0022206D0C|nr:uncharacterized protein B0P05DRAFT_520892 [Gilbertella persicaria]KAI8098203.1 hypothetical protein B0P05DRAFT_520892 [Gilbertella persicaria]